MPSAIQVQEFSEQLYCALDPFDRGYVDLRTVSSRLASLAPAVAEFVRRVLVACEDEFEPSEFVFKADLMGRLIFAVDQEHNQLAQEEQPKQPIQVLDQPIVSRQQIHIPASLSGAGGPASAADPAAVAAARRDVEGRKQALIAASLKECTFTPKVGRRPRRRRPTSRSLSRSREKESVEETAAPEGGAKLTVAVDAQFRATLRERRPVDLTRLMRGTESAQNRGHTRGFLMFRINEADKFYGLMIANDCILFCCVD